MKSSRIGRASLVLGLLVTLAWPFVPTHAQDVEAPAETPAWEAVRVAAERGFEVCKMKLEHGTIGHEEAAVWSRRILEAELELGTGDRQAHLQRVQVLLQDVQSRHEVGAVSKAEVVYVEYHVAVAEAELANAE